MGKEEEIDSKEVNDALHMLLHCALKDKEYETQKEQFEIVISYINKLEQENNNLKAAALKNDDLYKEVCNKNKELEEENRELKKVKTDGFMVNNPWLFKYLSEVYIPKSLIKEKIEEIKEKDKKHNTYTKYLAIPILQELLRRRGEIRCVSIATSK